MYRQNIGNDMPRIRWGCGLSLVAFFIPKMVGIV